MIKVNCKDGSEPVKETYPCLKKSDNGRIVVFTARHTGYVLKRIDGDTDIFLYHSEHWCEEIYKPYPGIIELSNEV